MTETERHTLLHGVRSLLLDAARLFARRPQWQAEAAAIVCSIDAGELQPASPHALEQYAKAAALRACAGPARVPKAARGQFPFNAPTALLRDVQPAIDAMLAPLSDRRTRAHALAQQRQQACQPTASEPAP